MKTRRSATWGLGLVIITVFAIGAAAQTEVKVQPVSEPRSEDIKAPATVSSGLPSAISGSARKATATAVSPWFTEVVKMAQAGIGPQPMLAFIDSAGTFNLTADQIVHLHALGLPGGLITAMLQHDMDLSSGVLPLPVTAVPKLPPPIKTIPVTNTAPVLAVGKPAVTSAPVAPELAMSPSELEEDGNIDDTPVVFEPLAPPGFSPVRKPYAVPLTDPIIIVRAPERMPNVISIEMR